MTLETSFRRLTRIDDRVRRTAAFYVQTSRPVTRLTTNVLRVLAFCLQSRMRRSTKVAHDLFMAGFTFLRADEFRAGNAGRRKNGSIGGAAGKENDGKRGSSSQAPQQSFAPTVDPSS